MAERNPGVKALVEQALSVLPQELGCDSYAEYLAAYADYRLGGKMPPDSLKGVGEHLDRCDACLEEFKLLLDAMQGADNHLGEPSALISHQPGCEGQAHCGIESAVALLGQRTFLWSVITSFLAASIPVRIISLLGWCWRKWRNQIKRYFGLPQRLSLLFRTR